MIISTINTKKQQNSILVFFNTHKYLFCTNAIPYRPGGHLSWRMPHKLCV